MVVESADTADLKFAARKSIRVRPPAIPRKSRVVVIGALGGVGQGIVQAMLERYRHEVESLIVTSRDAGRLAEFHASIHASPLVVPIVGGVADSVEASRLRDAILENGPIDIVIASLGGWWSGSPFTDIDDVTWRAEIDSLLTTHAVSARTFIPILTNDRSKYLLIGGGAGLRPVPGSSLVSIAGAAQMMLTRALVAERTDPARPLIAELVVDGPILTNAPHHGPVTSNEITALEVGRSVAGWCFEQRFSWPESLLAQDGPITIMRPLHTEV